jgi:hypothetical protein
MRGAGSFLCLIVSMHTLLTLALLAEAKTPQLKLPNSGQSEL